MKKLLRGFNNIFLKPGSVHLGNAVNDKAFERYLYSKFYRDVTDSDYPLLDERF